MIVLRSKCGHEVGSGLVVPLRTLSIITWWLNLSRLMTKPTKWVCAQRRLRSAWASAQSHQSSLCAQCVAKDLRFLHADSKCPGWSESSLGAHAILVVLSWGGSFDEVLPWYYTQFVVSLKNNGFEYKQKVVFSYRGYIIYWLTLVPYKNHIHLMMASDKLVYKFPDKFQRH